MLAAILLMVSGVFVAIGEESVSADDPEGDVSAFNAGFDEAAGVDVTGVRVSYKDGILVYIVEVAGSLKDKGMYAYDVVLEVNQVVRYEVAVVITDGSVTMAYFILEGHPSGTLTSDKVNVTVRDSLLEFRVALPSELSPFNKDKFEGEVEYWIIANTRYTSTETGGMAGDDLTALIQPSGGEPTETTTTGTMGEEVTGGEVNETTGLIFRDLNARAEGVDVEIRGTPTVKLMLTESSKVPGLRIAVMEVNVEGGSTGASHVALAIEVFVNGELASQYVVNTLTLGHSDDDGVENGYQMSFTIPQLQGANVDFEVREELTPLDGWGTWRYNSIYKIPVGPKYISEMQFAKLISELEKGNAEVYITAIAFSGLDENQYTTVTKKAELSYSIGGGEQPITTTTTMVTSKKQVTVPGTTVTPILTTTTTDTGTTSVVAENGESGGVPIALVAAIIVVVVAAGAAFAFLRR